METQDTSSLGMSTTHDKAIQLFTYLKELCKLRTTHVKDIASYDHVLSFSDIPRNSGCSCIAWDLWVPPDEGAEDRGQVWLEVQKPMLSSTPEVPDDLPCRCPGFWSRPWPVPCRLNTACSARPSLPPGHSRQFEPVRVPTYICRNTRRQTKHFLVAVHGSCSQPLLRDFGAMDARPIPIPIRP